MPLPPRVLHLLALLLAIASVTVALPPSAPADSPPGNGAIGWPVQPRTAARDFRLDEVDPYRAGQHRGLDLPAAAGTAVRAACSGRVTFAGRTPRGPAVTIACAERSARGLRVSHGRVRAIAVRAGTTVARGDRIATIPAAREVPSDGTPGPHLQLGVRRDGRYLDPAPLLGASAAPGDRPLGPAPRGDRRVPAPPAAAPRTAVPAAGPRLPAPAPRAVPATRVGEPGRAPASAGQAPLLPLGLGLLIAALVVPGLRRTALRATARRSCDPGPNPARGYAP